MASIMQNQSALVSHIVLNLPLRWLVVRLGAHHYLNVYAEDLASRYGDAKTSSTPYAFSLSAPLTETQAAQVAAQIGQAQISTFQGWGDLASHATTGRVMRASEVFGIGAPLAPTPPQAAPSEGAEVAKLQSEIAALKAKLAKTRADARLMHTDLSGEIKRLMGEASASPKSAPLAPQEATPEPDHALRAWALSWTATRKLTDAKARQARLSTLTREGLSEGFIGPDDTFRAIDKIAKSALT